MVRFLADNGIGTVSVKRIVKPLPSSLGLRDICTVQWHDGPYEAIVLAKGTFCSIAASTECIRGV